MFLRMFCTFALCFGLVLSCSDEITNNYYDDTGGAVFGTVVPAATGTAKLVGGQQLTTPIDENGIFNFANVPPGTYSLIIEPDDYTKRVINEVIVGTGVTAQYRNTQISKFPYPIYEINPANDAINVRTYSNFRIRCDELLNLEDLRNFSHFEPAVEGMWELYSDLYKVVADEDFYVFYPLEELYPATNYHLIIDESVRTEAGQPLGGDIDVSFTTENTYISFRVRENEGSGLVSRRGFRAEVNLGKCMDADSVAKAIRFVPEIPGVWVPDEIFGRCEGVGIARQFDFLATNLPLQPRTSYIAIIDGGPIGSLETDTVEFESEGYQVAEVAPRNGYYGVPRDNQVLVIFNEPMDTQSAQAAFSVKKADGTEVPGTFGWNAERTEMMWSHWENLYSPGVYTIKVTTEAKTESGEKLNVGWESYFQVL